MTIRYNYQGPTPPDTRYVRYRPHDGTFFFCETVGTKPQYDEAQGTCDREDLPDDIAEAAIALGDQAYGFVVWPFT